MKLTRATTVTMLMTSKGDRRKGVFAPESKILGLVPSVACSNLCLLPRFLVKFAPSRRDHRNPDVKGRLRKFKSRKKLASKSIPACGRDALSFEERMAIYLRMKGMPVPLSAL